MSPERSRDDESSLTETPLAEGVFVLCMLILILATWPNVPWDLLQFGAPVLMVLFPIFFFPFSKAIWLAFDVAFRPVTPDEVNTPRTC
jgi:hypothetical protein